MTGKEVDEGYMLLHSCDAGRSELGSRSSDFIVFMCTEVIKWDCHESFKKDGLHFRS